MKLRIPTPARNCRPKHRFLHKNHLTVVAYLTGMTPKNPLEASAVNEASPESVIRKAVELARNRELEEGKEDAQEEIMRFVDELRARYTDFADYSYYHVLVSSTPAAPCSKTDFRGKDSIVAFAERLITRYGEPS